MQHAASAYFQRHVPPGHTATTRGLAKLATRQSEYYFCGDLLFDQDMLTLAPRKFKEVERGTCRYRRISNL